MPTVFETVTASPKALANFIVNNAEHFQHEYRCSFIDHDVGDSCGDDTSVNSCYECIIRRLKQEANEYNI